MNNSMSPPNGTVPNNLTLQPNGYTNGYTNGTSNPETYDLICVGFGPAALAIAIALHERTDPEPKNVLFLDRQSEFAWHSGMLLPETRMQISFMKDLATMRNPQSKFTFINYLHQKGRLASFLNLGTFLPFREEYNDYMAWCASHFDSQVKYSEDVISVLPVRTEVDAPDGDAPVSAWEVLSTSQSTGKTSSYKTKNLVTRFQGVCTDEEGGF